MKVHEIMTEFGKLDPNEEVYFDNGSGGVPVTNIKIVPMNKPHKKGAIRYYPYGDGVKRCKSKSILLFNKNSISETLLKIQ